MKKTQHYNLNMPDPNDYVNVEDLNKNMESIDEALYRLLTKIDDMGKQLKEEILDLIDAHNLDPDAHPAIQTELSRLDARLTLLELMYGTDVSGNPFNITFGDLAGLQVEGVHNTALQRIEF